MTTIFSQGNNKNLIRGNKALALMLGVHPQTVQKWRKEGLLAPAIVAEFRRIIIYDITKVLDCLRHDKVAPGRPKAI